MSEKPINPYEGLSEEEREMYEQYMIDHPEVKIPVEDLKDYKERAATLEESLAKFERDFNLEELFAITNLTPEDAPNHPIREPARQALIPIVSYLKSLKSETNIPDDIYDVLEQRYKRLSRAVGMINKNIVDHTR